MKHQKEKHWSNEIWEIQYNKRITILKYLDVLNFNFIILVTCINKFLDKTARDLYEFSFRFGTCNKIL